MIKPSDRIAVTEAAELLGIAASTLRGWIMRKGLQVDKVGFMNFVSRAQIQKWIDKPDTRPVRGYRKAA